MTKKQKLRNEADKLWREVCFKRYGNRCELCGGTYKTTPHHFFYKSSFGHLRYSISNAVVLCWKCHFRLHNRDPKLIEAEIIAKRNKRWYNKLLKQAKNRPEGSYKTIKWYQIQIQNLLKNV